LLIVATKKRTGDAREVAAKKKPDRPLRSLSGFACSMQSQSFFVNLSRKDEVTTRAAKLCDAFQQKMGLSAKLAGGQAGVWSVNFSHH